MFKKIEKKFVRLQTFFQFFFFAFLSLPILGPAMQTPEMPGAKRIEGGEDDNNGEQKAEVPMLWTSRVEKTIGIA